MQQRRFRPGDVLDDYCPRERRITDHAVVAMIDDNIKQTRCVVCDAEHEYKEGKVPPQRRKKPQAALFTQVLDGLQGPHPARVSLQAEAEAPPDIGSDEATGLMPSPPLLMPSPPSGNGNGSGQIEPPITLAEENPRTAPAPPIEGGVVPAVVAQATQHHEASQLTRDEGPVRRSLIRATLPRPEGQPAPTRVMPEFTIHQPTNGRGGHRPGGRRRGGQHHGHGGQGSTRFGRSGQGQGQGQGQRQHGGRNHGPGRRRGKKR